MIGRSPTFVKVTGSKLTTAVHLLEQCGYDLGLLPQRSFKIVYVAPMKASVQEVVRTMGQRLGPFGLRVGEFTGDQGMTRFQISETHLLVTMPEKWDVLTRRPTHSQAALAQVRLVIMDEIHLLHDDRGPVLESLIARSSQDLASLQSAPSTSALHLQSNTRKK